MWSTWKILKSHFFTTKCSLFFPKIFRLEMLLRKSQETSSYEWFIDAFKSRVVKSKQFHARYLFLLMRNVISNGTYCIRKCKFTRQERPHCEKPSLKKISLKRIRFFVDAIATLHMSKIKCLLNLNESLENFVDFCKFC